MRLVSEAKTETQGGARRGDILTFSLTRERRDAKLPQSPITAAVDLPSLGQRLP